jgi:hypothetical protein
MGRTSLEKQRSAPTRIVMLNFRRSSFAFILTTLMHSSPAEACSDNQNCGPTANPVRKFYDSCSALPLLSPGNDSRVNFWLLADDLRTIPLDVRNGKTNITPTDLWPVPFSYSILISAAMPPAPPPGEGGALWSFARGEGTRCVSEARGRAEFQAALNAASLTPDEKSALASMRTALGGKCGVPAVDHNAGQLQGTTIKSGLGLEFLRYISAASAFYDARFDEASSDFETLSKSGDPWLKESASYMVGRVLLNKGQVGAFSLDGGDDKPQVKDFDSLKAAEKAFDAYMKAYPNGRYGASARGLMRRLYWLEGDEKRLVAEYGRLARENGADAASRFDFAEEIDNKMLIPGIGVSHDPMLLATRDLMRLRSPRDDKNTLSAAELQAQEPDFAANEALYEYLKAARAFFVDDDAKAALDLLGPPARGGAKSNLDFSRETLRALASSALGDKAAETVWKGLIAGADRPWRRETAELGLAWVWEREQTVNKVFMPDTPVRSQTIREILLRNIAGPILLRQQADDETAPPRERAVARFTLLYKEATRGHYSGFLKDYAAAEPVLDDTRSYFSVARGLNVFRWQGQKAPFACSLLKAIVERLASAAKDAHALLCLAEFTRTQGLDSIELEQRPAADQLGGQKSIFPGPPFSRGEIYHAVIADPSTPDDARAYAYYRAIHCYEPSGVNGCGGADVGKSVRKGWYDALKRRYGSLGYVKALRYYW